MLWGNLDNATGNQKPLFANTSNISSSSTINGPVANTDAYYGNVYGLSVTEMPNVAIGKPTHAGWVSTKIGTGYVKEVQIVDPGSGINANGFLTITDTSYHGKGTGANVFFETANSQNTMQRFSTNPAWNVVGSVTVTNGGTGYSDGNSITVVSPGANTNAAVFQVVLGGKAGRVSYETLVAMGSITSDDPRDNPVFPGT